MLDTPIAFVIFNRPESTKVSFERIRGARPSKLFLIADAPRTDRPDEIELVKQARQVCEDVDWPCDVTRIYADSNMGCGRRISSGVTEAFKHVERLIVLEDDCIADPSFFDFCENLLDHHAEDERVMAISGNNHQMGQRRSAASYYFSKFPHCWGWATWRRAWNHFDLGISDWLSIRQSGQLGTICDSRREIDYWTEVFDKVYDGKSQSWAFPWHLACWINHGLAALPEVNLVSNIGFGADATHTKKLSPIAFSSTKQLDSIVHPARVCRNLAADRFTDELMFSGANRGGPFKQLEKNVRAKRKARQFAKRHAHLFNEMKCRAA